MKSADPSGYANVATAPTASRRSTTTKVRHISRLD
jgi:hypothetical protein